MSRDTDTWVFNIDSNNWEICAAGPEDSSKHPEEYLGQPCHGIRSVKNAKPEKLQQGDLILVRESGEGLRGIWRYLDKQNISGKEQELWDDATYDWMLYCEALELDFDKLYNEPWEKIATAVDRSVRSVTSSFRNISNLSVPLKREYLTHLLTDLDLSNAAGDAIIESLQALDEIPNILQSPSSADPAPYYWVNQTSKTHQIEEEILEAPVRTNEPTHDFSRLSAGDTTFHYSGGKILGFSTVSGTSSLYWDSEESEQKKKLRQRVPVDLTQFEQPLLFREVFEVLADEENRIPNSPVHDSGLNSGYLFNLSPEAGKYLRTQGTEWEPHSVVEALRDTDNGSVYMCSFNPSDHLTTLRRGAVLLWSGKESAWKRISPGDVVLFHAKYEEDVVDGGEEDVPPGIIGGAVVESKTTKRERWALNEKDSLGKPYLLNLEQIHTTADTDRLALDRPTFSLTQSEFESEYAALMDGCLSIERANEISQDVQEKDLPSRSFSKVHAPFKTLIELTERLFEAMRPRLHHFEPPEDLPGMLPRPNGDVDLQPSLTRRVSDVGQLIFYGPPGTGKTFKATHLARDWVYDTATTPPADNQVQTVTFHPSVSYEDFVEGLTATKGSEDDAVSYEYEPGTFKRIYNDARKAYERSDGENSPRYVLIIDEINRGNVPQILGELITLLESEKRLGEKQEASVQAAHSGDTLTLPPNLYIIGTMNTADQSIALIDAAIRRRFSFHSFPPDTQVILENSSLLDSTDDLDTLAEEAAVNPESLLARSVKALEQLNRRIVNGDPGRGQRLGHTYLMGAGDTTDICDAWLFDILPLLEEYYFGDIDRLRADLLTNEDSDEDVADQLFDSQTGEVNPELNPDNLYEALGELLGIDSADQDEEMSEE